MVLQQPLVIKAESLRGSRELSKGEVDVWSVIER